MNVCVQFITNFITWRYLIRTHCGVHLFRILARNMRAQFGHSILRPAIVSRIHLRTVGWEGGIPTFPDCIKPKGLIQSLHY